MDEVSRSVKTKRIIFCTYSSLYSSIVLEQLIANESVDVVAIINSIRVIHPKYGFIRGGLKQIQLSGLRYASYLFMVTDLFRWLQPLSKLTKLNLKKSVHRLAIQHSIPLLDTQDINRTEAINFIEQRKPDYLLASHFNQLVKPAVLDLTDVESINIHPSILPSYKGVDPVFHALLDQKTKIGVTLHKMSDDFDSGEILDQKTISADTEHSVCFYNCQLFEEGAKLAIDWVNAKTPGKNSVDISASNSSDSNNFDQSYDSWPSRAQIKQYKQSGKQLIDLSELWNR